MPEEEFGKRAYDQCRRKLINICLFLISLYRKYISPNKPQSCRFYPSCSIYMYESIERFGITQGILLGLRRILKCHPLHPGGYDPIPRLDNNGGRLSHD